MATLCARDLEVTHTTHNAQGKRRREATTMETITISRATAERLLNRMADWLEYIDGLDYETRADIIALDELVKALDAEEQLVQLEQQRRDELQRLHAEHAARQAANG